MFHNRQRPASIPSNGRHHEPAPADGAMPCWIAHTAAWVRFWALILRMTFLKCIFTVDSVMFRLRAITLFDWPPSRQRRIWISRFDKSLLAGIARTAIER